MIIKLLLELIYNVFSLLTVAIDIPDMPPIVNGYINILVEYIGTGKEILSNYVNLSYLLTLFGVIVAVDVGIWLYKLVMYFIKKIPMINIS